MNAGFKGNGFIKYFSARIPFGRKSTFFNPNENRIVRKPWKNINFIENDVCIFQTSALEQICHKISLSMKCVVLSTLFGKIIMNVNGCFLWINSA